MSYQLKRILRGNKSANFWHNFWVRVKLPVLNFSSSPLETSVLPPWEQLSLHRFPLTTNYSSEDKITFKLAHNIEKRVSFKSFLGYHSIHVLYSSAFCFSKNIEHQVESNLKYDWSKTFLTKVQAIQDGPAESSRWLFQVTSAGVPTTVLGKLLQFLIFLIVKNLLPMANWSLTRSTLYPLSSFPCDSL